MHSDRSVWKLLSDTFFLVKDKITLIFKSLTIICEEINNEKMHVTDWERYMFSVW